MDNARLRELLEMRVNNEEFIELLKNTEFCVPVELSDNDENVYEIELDGKTIHFNLKTANDGEGTVGLPLFTGKDTLEAFCFKGDVLVLHASDLSDMLLRKSQNINVVVFDPNSNHSIVITIDSFLKIFLDQNKEYMNFLEKKIKEESIPLKDNIRVIFTENEPNMKNKALNGIFTTEKPIGASLPDIHDKNKYKNILLMPKGKMILYIGDIVNHETDDDIILAPKTEFKFVEQLNSKTFVWECINQPFFD